MVTKYSLYAWITMNYPPQQIHHELVKPAAPAFLTVHDKSPKSTAFPVDAIVIY